MSSGRKKRRNTLLWQLSATIAGFTIVVESILLVGSYHTRRVELIQIQERIRASDNPKAEIMTDQEIKERLGEFTENVILLVLVIVFTVTAGTLFVFDFFAGSHIRRLYQLNRETKHGKYAYYPKELVPSNELGAVIESREEMLKELESYQNDLASKLEETKEQMLHSAKLTTVGQLTSSIVHDISNPLSVVDSYARMLSRKVEGGTFDQQAFLKALKKIEFASGRIIRLVKSVNSFGRRDLELKEGVDVTQIISDAVVLVEKKIQLLGIELHTSVPVRLPTIYGDAASIELVLMNLVSNACDAMESSEKRNLDIYAESNEEEVVIEVTDSGHGIPADKLENVFKSFFTTKKAGRGTGLGLSICKDIVDKHGGEIAVKSEPGKGTTFRLTLKQRAAGAKKAAA